MVMLLQLAKYLIKAAAKAEEGVIMAPLVAYLVKPEQIETNGEGSGARLE